MVNSKMSGTVVIKKYSNRRLYNTQISNYVTLEDLFDMVKEDVDFIVKDAKTGEDLTHNVLTQIIFEQEAKGYIMLPVSFLRQIISFYGDKVASILPQYLESSMKSFAANHEKMSQMTFDTNNYTPMKFFGPITCAGFG